MSAFWSYPPFCLKGGTLLAYSLPKGNSWMLSWLSDRLAAGLLLVLVMHFRTCTARVAGC